MHDYDVIVIGGGPAGLAAALAANENGARVLVVEREERLGGMLKQCIHDGFGLRRLGERLAGPEYVERFMDKIAQSDIEAACNTFVTRAEKTESGFAVTLVLREGLRTVTAKSLVLATGCRERSAKQVFIHGTRPAGVFTAGTAQHFTNRLGVMPTKKCVILGSGDIGLIMARRMTWEGAKVRMVCEIMPYSSGLTRNIVQCLEDNDIPLRYEYTVTRVHGDRRVTGVTVAKVDQNRRPIPETEEFVECDTLLLSVGLIPENEVAQGLDIEMDPVTQGAVVDENRETTAAGVFACGNVLHVHDLVDFVSMESEALARHAAAYVEGKGIDPCTLDVKCGEGVGHTIPQKVSGKNDFSLSLRVRNHYRDCRIVVRQNGVEVAAKKMKKAIPAEMIQFKVSAAKLQETGALEVSVE